MVNWKLFLYGALTYLIITFPLAVLWHVVAFKDIYDSLGYFGREEPSFVLGLLSIVVQGAVLSYAFPIFCRGAATVASGLKYGLMAGILLWSCHVAAFAAKSELSSVPGFFAMESVYISLQFGLYGPLLGWIYSRARSRITKG